MSAPPRSSRREVRNPLLALPELQALLDLPADQRVLMARLVKAFAKASFDKGQHCWDTAKPPMAAYYRASSTVAKHLAHALKRGRS